MVETDVLLVGDGWLVTQERKGLHPFLYLRRNRKSPRFDSDGEAWLHVVEGARDGDATARQALTLLRDTATHRSDFEHIERLHKLDFV